MSASWARGSSRAWRKLRAYVLDRDGRRCKVPVEAGHLCGKPARTVGHLDPLHQGNPKLAPADRLRAECAAHNFGDGARITNSRRRQRSWSW